MEKLALIKIIQILRTFKFKIKATHHMRAVFLHECITYSSDSHLFNQGFSTTQTWVMFISDCSLLSRESRQLCSRTHMYVTVHSDHTDRDNPFFSKAIFKTIYYALSFISSSIFLFSAYSHDSYVLDKTEQITFILVHPTSTSQSLGEIKLHIFQDLQSIQRDNLTLKHLWGFFSSSWFLTLSNS